MINDCFNDFSSEFQGFFFRPPPRRCAREEFFNVLCSARKKEGVGGV